MILDAGQTHVCRNQCFALTEHYLTLVELVPYQGVRTFCPLLRQATSSILTHRASQVDKCRRGSGIDCTDCGGISVH